MLIMLCLCVWYRRVQLFLERHRSKSRRRRRDATIWDSYARRYERRRRRQKGRRWWWWWWWSQAQKGRRCWPCRRSGGRRRSERDACSQEAAQERPFEETAGADGGSASCERLVERRCSTCRRCRYERDERQWRRERNEQRCSEWDERGRKRDAFFLASCGKGVQSKEMLLSVSSVNLNFWLVGIVWRSFGWRGAR